MCVIKDRDQEYVKCVANLTGNLSNLARLNQETEKEYFEDKRDTIQEALKGQQRPFKRYVEWDEFSRQYLEIRGRYKFFVLQGSSCTGKTVWAKNVTGNLAEVLYVNCASCPEPNLRGITYRTKVILLDEASPAMLLNQKLLVQTGPEWVELGCSTIMLWMKSWEVTS